MEHLQHNVIRAHSILCRFLDHNIDSVGRVNFKISCRCASVMDFVSPRQQLSNADRSAREGHGQHHECMPARSLSERGVYHYRQAYQNPPSLQRQNSWVDFSEQTPVREWGGVRWVESQNTGPQRSGASLFFGEGRGGWVVASSCSDSPDRATISPLHTPRARRGDVKA